MRLILLALSLATAITPAIGSTNTRTRGNVAVARPSTDLRTALDRELPVLGQPPIVVRPDTSPNGKPILRIAYRTGDIITGNDGTPFAAIIIDSGFVIVLQNGSCVSVTPPRVDPRRDPATVKRLCTLLNREDWQKVFRRVIDYANRYGSHATR